MRICQTLNLLLLIFLSNCSTPKIEEIQTEGLISSNWLNVPLRFAHRDNDDNYLIHPFFDAQTDFDKEKNSINYILTTVEDSKAKYDLDLLSGRLYRQHNYCKQDDVWGLYDGSIDYPNFTEGIIPRVYNQQGDPLKIIVFGAKKNIPEKLKYNPVQFNSAKLIGSFIIEKCGNYPCDSKIRWKRSQILIGVNAQSATFGKIQDLKDLKKLVDWNYLKAFVANQDGVHQLGSINSPVLRIVREYGISDTLAYYTTNNTAVNLTELKQWREKCFSIYDEFWNRSEKIRTFKLEQKEKFLEYFKNLYSNNSEMLYSCLKLVRAGNINDDPNRFWFFAFIQAFVNLERNGFYYSCSNGAWSYNPKISEDKQYSSQLKELEHCSAQDFEKSFERAINGLSMMSFQIKKSYRFVEYDSGIGGSHQKLYSWIQSDSLALLCKDKSELNKVNQFDIFPQDVTWPEYKADIVEKIIK